MNDKMLVIVKVEIIDDEMKFNVLEIYSGSRFDCSLAELKVLIAAGFKLIKLQENVDLDESTVDKLGAISKYVLIGKTSDNSCVSVVGRHCIKSDTNRLFQCIVDGQYNNCYNGDRKDGYELLASDKKLGSMWVKGLMDLTSVEGFEESIKLKYNSFVLKTSALGYSCSFEYTIIKDQVIYERYTGNGGNVLMPSFITIVKQGAFSFSKIDTVTLGRNVRILGDSAFSFSSIKNIELNDALKIIGKCAFMGCSVRCSGVPESTVLVCEDAFDDDNRNILVRHRVKVSGNTIVQ